MRTNVLSIDNRHSSPTYFWAKTLHKMEVGDECREMIKNIK